MEAGFCWKLNNLITAFSKGEVERNEQTGIDIPNKKINTVYYFLIWSKFKSDEN